MPPATAASKPSATPLFSASRASADAVVGEQRLVGGDHRLAGFERRLDGGLAPGRPRRRSARRAVDVAGARRAPPDRRTSRQPAEVDAAVARAVARRDGGDARCAAGARPRARRRCARACGRRRRRQCRDRRRRCGSSTWSSICPAVGGRRPARGAGSPMRRRLCCREANSGRPRNKTAPAIAIRPRRDAGPPRRPGRRGPGIEDVPEECVPVGAPRRRLGRAVREERDQEQHADQRDEPPAGARRSGLGPTGAAR